MRVCGGVGLCQTSLPPYTTADPTHSLVRLTSHNLETREPHPKNTSPACLQPPVTTAAEVGRLLSPCTPEAVLGGRRVLILCSPFLSIKTFKGGGAFVQMTWLSSAVISRERANSSSHPADTEGKPSGFGGGHSAASSRPATPDTTDSGHPPACCVLRDFQRGGNVALGTPGYRYEA